ncbi:MAG: hypothetical protein AAF960_09545 [Bacteroidota bacterium]
MRLIVPAGRYVRSSSIIRTGRAVGTVYTVPTAQETATQFFSTDILSRWDNKFPALHLIHHQNKKCD